jgi:outer membrane immunogenic protein
MILMRNFMLAAVGAFALSVSASAVNAADVDMASTYDWSGHYAGVTAGYGWGNATQYDLTIFNSDEIDMDGFIAGGTLGYNHQMDSFLIGLESDISFSGMNGDTATSATWGCGAVANGCQAEVDWFSTTRVRLGMPMDAFLPYITGGLALGGVQSEIVGDPNFQLDEIEFGWTVGGGLEAAVSENMTVKAEVLYVDFGRSRADASPASFAVDTDFIAARVGLNFQF